jgi:glycogen phosphorylase/synthase
MLTDQANPASQTSQIPAEAASPPALSPCAARESANLAASHLQYATSPASVHKFLFEVSWEVCNKVGGIYTVLRSKIKEAIKDFGSNNYILIGPLLENNNRHFVEDNAPRYTTIRDILQNKGINCKVGYWDTEGSPIVILVDFKNRYKIDVLLYNLWTDFKVDSLASNYDYQEPILFATAAAEAIEALAKNHVDSNNPIIAHFHEWLGGAGLLYLKRHCGEISTVFTTHATVLGRSLASDGISIYNLPKGFDPTTEARNHNVFAKHSLEKAAAREAHCFTTVSAITADEAYLMLSKYPDKIVFNGLDIEQKQHYVVENALKETRQKLREIASKVIGKVLPENTLLWLTSGRYEFHNKGFDVLLNSLAQLEKRLPPAPESPPIVLFFLIAANWHTKQDSLLDNSGLANDPEQKSALGFATHKLYKPDQDQILKLCNELNLRASEKIHIVFSDAYLNGNDGVFDMVYEQALAACDLSIFPSFYEPWGYTPLESITQSTPTITTDLAGFGTWVHSLTADYQEAVYVLERKNITDLAFTETLTSCLERIIKQGQKAEHVLDVCKKAFAIGALADWSFFYAEYLNAYYQAIRFNEIYHNKLTETAIVESKSLTAIYEAETPLPRFRTFQYDSPLPHQIGELREIAYNFWWSWHEQAKALFKQINSDLWEKVRGNPVHFLNRISSSSLQRATLNNDYMRLYEDIVSSFHDYHHDKDPIRSCLSNTALDEEHPVAYFCMEYGIDECLPIYSGGLGILAGDYLKAMSDLKIPFIAIGLFYRQGYFLQNINSRGEQVAIYKTWNTNQIPMRQMRDENGKLILIGVEILGHAVFAKIWEAHVGHVKLYLLDTDVIDNTPEDREITNNLYGGSHEVRLKQEMILGIGGARFILEKLKVKPLLYHLNEGHSAFLLLERIRHYCHQGMPRQNAVELVRCTSIFTTHTPVAAGNEEFAPELIRKYFAYYAETISTLGITLNDLFALAHNGSPESRAFSMTAMALRLCLYSNAVSMLHGKVARAMWQGLWPGLLEDEVPITHITNGVHLATWLGTNMKQLYNEYLDKKWESKQDDATTWQKTMSIPDAKLWETHQTQKNALIEVVRDMIMHQYSARNESKLLINNSIRSLHQDVLLLGLARRFTSYKRNDLILKDIERLTRILTSAERPIVMLIAGKAHPADGSGNNLIREIIDIIRTPQLNGHIIFLEEYNIALAKLLEPGVDVWLNTPLRGSEACGTSGMKVGINGGLNFSTEDGWWDEAYNPSVGWEIESLTNIEDIDKRNDMENMFLLNTLENDIAHLYYDRKSAGFNPDWVNKMKTSIALIACKYNTVRMARDYINALYCPALQHAEKMYVNNYQLLNTTTCWEHGIAERFNTVKIKAILIDGIKDGKIISQGKVKVKLLVFAGKLAPDELHAEIVLVKTDGKKFVDKPIIIPLTLVDSQELGVLTYTAEYLIDDTGFYSYGIRIFPYNENLAHSHDTGIVYWG